MIQSQAPFFNTLGRYRNRALQSCGCYVVSCGSSVLGLSHLADARAGFDSDRVPEPAQGLEVIASATRGGTR